jgi:hypothetical protein
MLRLSTTTHIQQVALLNTFAHCRYEPDALVGILSAQVHVGHHDQEFALACASHLSAPASLAAMSTGSLTQAAWVTAMLASQGVLSYDEHQPVQELAAAIARQAGRQARVFVGWLVGWLIGWPMSTLVGWEAGGVHGSSQVAPASLPSS